MLLSIVDFLSMGRPGLKMRLRRALAHMRRISPTRLRGARSARLANDDARMRASHIGHPFSLGNRPVIRWIKGDGLDDEITKTALATASALFGDRVDYCLCTHTIGAKRARAILAASSQPVEWWPLSELDNAPLADRLRAAGCAPAKFGYWWKWFPERVRPNAPEWILDGDMVITSYPKWFEDWVSGRDTARLTHDCQRWGKLNLYGDYHHFVPDDQRPYSGLLSVGPGQRYLPQMLTILDQQPLREGHDGCEDMDEQGVVAGALNSIAVPIPLHEFPFARAFETKIDYGPAGDIGQGWGFHFGNSFRLDNPLFAQMMETGLLHVTSTSQPNDEFRWLGNLGQWGIPGWAMHHDMLALIIDRARHFAGRRVLELGTSRGQLTAALANVNCRVTTVDLADRGATLNMRGLDVKVVVMDAQTFLREAKTCYDLIVVDVHGNTPKNWEKIGPLILSSLAQNGILLINNACLGDIPDWFEERGVPKFLATLPKTWRINVLSKPSPGLAIVEART
jgi:predicted O-methyltransferase YrrM